MSAYTLTFGDCAENHVGMQKIGSISNEGLNFDCLDYCQNYFRENNLETELVNLNQFADVDEETAYILIVRNAVNFILNSEQGTEEMFLEQQNLNYDKKAFMKGRVVNKIARHNICFSHYDQEPNYEDKKGRIVSFERVPLLQRVKLFLENLTQRYNLQCEGNHYYDVKNTYIGFHGDTERKIVIAVRLGNVKFPLHFRWYCNSNAIGNQFSVMLYPGDIYFMSEKAVGTDWKKRKISTLRHSAGYKVQNLQLNLERRIARYNRKTKNYDYFFLNKKWLQNILLMVL